MNFPSRAIVFIVIALIFAGCNTMYNSRMIKLDILEPAKVYFPSNIKNVAFRYNNVNVSYNESTATYLSNNTVYTDTINNDSVLSFIYFNNLVDGLRENHFFDSVFVIPQGNYTNSQFMYLPPDSSTLKTDTSIENIDYQTNNAIPLFVNCLKTLDPGRNQFSNKKIIHPELGLYTKNDLSKIRRNTNADVLFSLDYFATTDYIHSIVSKQFPFPETFAIVFSIFNIYDLSDNRLKYYYFINDTIRENETGLSNVFVNNQIIRNIFLSNASSAAAINLVNYLIPHWVDIQRTVYYSRNKNLKPASALIDYGNWKEAAEIWELYKNHRNKRIKAQCLYNLGVSKEIEGDFKRAIEYISESYSVFETRNEVHKFNCMDYLKILQQRKKDSKLIDFQINPK